ncbi:MAG: SPOR domain-containing protein [Bauldia sp.]
MPDKYDPRLSMRPSGDRKPPGAGADADDPLFELARLVSGKGLEAAGSRHGERAPPAPRGPLPSETELARDLESELLNELQASFSMLQEPIASTLQPASPRIPVAAPLAAPPAPSMAIPEPPAAPPPPPLVRPVARQPERTERPQPVERQEPRVERQEPRVERQEPRAERQEPRVERVLRPERGLTPAPQNPAERVASFRPPSQPNDLSNLQFRPTSAPAQALPPAPRAVEPPARSASPRWMPRTERRADAPLPRYTPQRALAPPPRQEREEHPLDDEPFDESLTLQDEGYFDEDEQDENFDLVPGYGDEDLLPPFPEDELAALQPRRSGRGVLMIAALFAVVVVGGAAAILLRSGNGTSSPPAVIAADASPTKVVPETGQPVDDQSQAKLIYDRVDPGEEAADSQLAAQENDPISDVAAESDESSNPISRVILPGGPGIDSTAESSAPEETATAATTEDDGSGIKPIGPKKVRTVVVRPDGTIVSSEAAAADGSVDATTAAAANGGDAAAGSEPPTSPSEGAAAATPPPAPASTSDTAELEAAAEQGGDIAAREGNGDQIALRESTEPLPLSGSDSAPEPAPPAAEEVAAPEPPAKPVRKPTIKPPTADATSDSGPIDITPTTKTRPRPAEQQTASLVPAGAMLVQVSSQRSEDAAQSTFRDLQKRFPQILGRYDANIQRADLGARGVYYRVRVGPFGGADAQKLCEALKGAGGDCILAQR